MGSPGQAESALPALVHGTRAARSNLHPTKMAPVFMPAPRKRFAVNSEWSSPESAGLPRMYVSTLFTERAERWNHRGTDL